MAHLLTKRMPEDASTGELGPDFQAARPLWNSEVKIILQHAQAMRAKEEKSPSGVLERSLVYAAQFDLFGSKENTEGARSAIKSFRKKHEGTSSVLTDFEAATLVNLAPFSKPEEPISLIPSLKHKFTEEQVQELLAELAPFQSRP